MHGTNRRKKVYSSYLNFFAKTALTEDGYIQKANVIPTSDLGLRLFKIIYASD